MNEYNSKHPSLNDIVVGKDNIMRIELRCNSLTQTFVIEATNASVKFHQFITSIIMENRMDNPDYKARSKCCAFFQGGSNDPNGGWVLIEMLNASNIDVAKEFYEYVMGKWSRVLAQSKEVCILCKEQAYYFWKTHKWIISISDGEENMYFLSKHKTMNWMGPDWVPCTAYGYPGFAVERPGLEDGIIDTVDKYLLVYDPKNKCIC